MKISIEDPLDFELMYNDDSKTKVIINFVCDGHNEFNIIIDKEEFKEELANMNIGGCLR